MRKENCTIERRSIRNIGLVFTGIGIFLWIIMIYNICAMVIPDYMPEIFTFLLLDDFLKVYYLLIAGIAAILIGWIFRKSGCP